MKRRSFLGALLAGPATAAALTTELRHEPGTDGEGIEYVFSSSTGESPWYDGAPALTQEAPHLYQMRRTIGPHGAVGPWSEPVLVGRLT